MFQAEARMPELLYDQNQNAPDTFPLARPLDMRPVTLDAENDIAWALAALKQQQRERQTYADYLRGEHKMVMSTQEYQRAFKQLLERLRCNVCPSVVHALTDRLKITGFSSAGTEGQAAWDLWKDQRLQRYANPLHNEAAAVGLAYILVWPDSDGVPRLYPHTALEMVHRVDAELRDVLTLAAKVWAKGKKTRLNLYYADRIERYITAQDTTGTLEARQFVPYEDEATNDVVPNDYGRVPVFPLLFDPDLKGNGCSVLHDVIPLQDALNTTIQNMLVAGEFAAYPQRYLLGIEPELDDLGNALPVPFKAGIDRLLTVANPDVKAGQWEAADLTKYEEIKAGYFRAIAAIKGIPLHYFHMTGDFPSGESLKTAESRLVAAVEDAQIDFGDVWAQVLAFMLRVQNGGDINISTVWAEAASRAEKESAEVLAIKRNDLGISQAQAWREAGYTPEQIAGMQQELELEPAGALDALDTALARG
jgi:hypothetical protein